MRTILLGALLCGAPALAHAECGADIGRLTEKRDALMNQIGAIPAPGEESKLDPAKACPKLRELVVALNESVAWFDANRQQCGINDAIVASVAGQRDRVAASTAQLCKSAPKAPPAKKRPAQ